MLDGFICDSCGFTSSEEVETGNTYYCPKCGNKMRRATHSGMFGGGDANASSSVLAWDIMYFIIVGSLSFGIMNYISYWTNDLLDLILFVLWIVLFVASFIFFHKTISSSVSNKAIKNNPNFHNSEIIRTTYSNNINKSLYCSNCGQKLQNDAKFCSNCGTHIER